MDAEQVARRGSLVLMWTVLLLALVVTACSQEPGNPSSPQGGARTVPSSGLPAPASPMPASGPSGARLTQVNTEGAVSIKVTPINLEGSGGTLEFEVALNTHSVDLSFDLAALAVLRNDRGDEVAGAAWDGGRGGHHLSGRLSFPTRDGRGNPLVAADTRYIKLLIRDVAGVPERVFRWELKP